MANLSTIISNINVAVEDNLERGTVYVFGTGSSLATTTCFCWKPPASGTAIIEAWGAGGSGGRMCCCGHSIPGNSGGYSRRTITVTASCFVCGALGISCGNASTMCFRGCSSPTSLCWTGSGTNGYICAEGGMGGYAICSTSASPWCCFGAQGFCATSTGTGCGIICNIFSGSWRGCAYGGDVNCSSNFSCVVFNSCDSGTNYFCGYNPVIAVPPGMGAVCGEAVGASGNTTTPEAQSSGMGVYIGQAAMINSNRGSGSMIYFPCWASGRACGCYEATGCIPYMPPATPGLGAYPCSDVRDSGVRGGHGLVKITFYT